MDLSGQLKLHELQTLEVLARTRSLVRAAEALNLTPAAVHTRLKSLEAKLGVPLYETTGHALHLTEAAEVILPHIRDVILDHEAIFASLKEWSGTDRGRVRIATGSTFSSYALPSLLEAFRRQSPDVEIVVATGKSRQLFEGLAKGAIDVAITLDTRLVEKPFFQVLAGWDFELVLVGAAGQPSGPFALPELQTVPFIAHARGSRLGELIDHYFAQHGFRPNVAMRFDHPATTKAMVATGLGVSLLPIWTVADDIAAGRLTRIEQREPPLVARMVLVTRRANYTPRAVAAFTRLATGWHWHGERPVP